ENPIFRASLERCDLAIRRHVKWSVIEELVADDQTQRLDQIDVVQPCLFAIQVSLSEMWRSLGGWARFVLGWGMCGGGGGLCCGQVESGGGGAGIWPKRQSPEGDERGRR